MLEHHTVGYNGLIEIDTLSGTLIDNIAQQASRASPEVPVCKLI